MQLRIKKAVFVLRDLRVWGLQVGVHETSGVETCWQIRVSKPQGPGFDLKAERQRESMQRGREEAGEGHRGRLRPAPLARFLPVLHIPLQGQGL